jgi:error-prone DNA polymerase
MVHPYLRRRAGREPVTVPHPTLEPILRRTLGVPLFQEQLLRMAMATAGFTGGEAEELRRALGFKRAARAMADIEGKLRAGMLRQGITGEPAEAIIRSITAFALYGFPESHAASFALLAYASTYLKAHHPAAFYAALLNNQPMGFYHPATIVRDAQRHGQVIHPIDVTRSGWLCAIEEDGAVRLGLRYVKGLREDAGKRLEAARLARPFDSVADLVRRGDVNREELARLGEVGALGGLGLDRRQALWEGERAIRPAGALYADLPDPPSPSPLRPMTEEEEVVADYAGMGLSVGPHPMALRRAALARQGVTRAAELADRRHGSAVRVAGAVVVRQRPGTAKGFVFLNLEDETGLINVIVRPQHFARYRELLTGEPFLLVDGRLQHEDGVISVRAERLRALAVRLGALPSHDFH